MRSGFTALGSSTLWLAGCSLVTEPWSYSEVSLLDASLDRLESGCAACVRTQCPGTVTHCEKTVACVDYVACRTAELSPLGDEVCSSNRIPPPEFTELTRCHGCFEACGFGAQLDCVGRYSWPPVESPVRWVQRLTDNEFVGGRKPLADVTVRACRSPGLSCGPSVSATPDPEVEHDLVAWAETDENGWYSLDLDVPPNAPGFEGLLIVHGPRIPVLRLHHAYPLRSGASETGLLTTDSLARVLGGRESSDSPLGALFQIHDCLRTPAKGVALTPISGGWHFVSYNSGVLGEPTNLEATTVEGLATGGVFGIEPVQNLVSLELLRDGKPVNKLVASVVPGEIAVLQVVPGTSSVVPPW